MCTASPSRKLPPTTKMATGRECDLCGLGCGNHPLRQHVGESDRFFCCVGCLNVYLILWESGAITAGQDIRQTELFQRSLQLGLISTARSEDAEPNVASTTASDEGAEKLLLRVSGMWCTSCAWLIEHAVGAMPGVARVEASFASDLVNVQYHPQKLPPESILRSIETLGYKPQNYSTATDASEVERRDLLIRTGLAAFLWANIMSFSLVLYAGYFEQISGSVRRGLPFLLMVLATPVIFYCGQPILRLAWSGLLNRTIRMEALLALGILAAYAYSVVQTFRGEIHLYFDTATVIVALVLAGKLIEHGAKGKASRWIAMLHSMMPNKVRLLVNGSERFVSVEALEPGETFVVKTGERIPADGLVCEGESHTDESLLTGESRPVRKYPGEIVVAGSINLDGVLTVQATKSASDSTLSRIIDLVERALGNRSALERAVDRISRIMVPCVIGIASLTFFSTWILGTLTPAQALMRAITVLVIACPCALGLATPLAITAAYGSASSHGILIRDSRVLDTLRKVDTILLDKTGTVTEGKFSLLELVPCYASPVPVLAAVATGPSAVFSDLRSSRRMASERDDELLSLLASVERYSEHPLGAAVAEFARRQPTSLRPVTSIEVHKGRGITGVVDGKNFFTGNRRLLRELGLCIDDDTERQACAWEEQGKTVAFVGWDGTLRAFAVFGDRVKPEALEFTAELKRRGIKVLLVSGDAPATTQWTASYLGIDSCESEALPEEKAEVVRRLQQRGTVVAVVGDGINDAPALAQADLGIALGSGTDIAMQAAAVVLMSGSLDKILDVLQLSQRTMRVVRQNLFWAFVYNTVGITLAVAGLLNPIMAASAMLLSSLSVVGNSMRLSRARI